LLRAVAAMRENRHASGHPRPRSGVHGLKQLQRKNSAFAVIRLMRTRVIRTISIDSTQVNGMKASVMKKLSNAHQAPKSSPQRFEWAQDKGSKLEPFYIAAIGSDRRSLARAMKFDQRR
jgi:hypothetical protein